MKCLSEGFPELAIERSPCSVLLLEDSQEGINQSDHYILIRRVTVINHVQSRKHRAGGKSKVSSFGEPLVRLFSALFVYCENLGVLRLGP